LFTLRFVRRKPLSLDKRATPGWRQPATSFLAGLAARATFVRFAWTRQKEPPDILTWLDWARAEAGWRA